MLRDAAGEPVEVVGAWSDITARTQLGEAVGLAESKATPEEVDAYKRFVMTVAQAAASAHKEGGFLGIGGEQVSEKERAALDELRGVIGADGATGGMTVTQETPPVGPDGSGNSN